MIHVSLLTNPFNIFLGLVITMAASFALSYLGRDMFYGMDDFIVGLPTLYGYPKRVDLFFALCVMVLFPCALYLSDKITRPVLQRISWPFSLSWPAVFNVTEKVRLVLYYHIVTCLLGIAAIYGIIMASAKAWFVFFSPQHVMEIMLGAGVFSLASLAIMLVLRHKLCLIYTKKIYGCIILLEQVLLLTFICAILPQPYVSKGYVINISDNLYTLIGILLVLAVFDLGYYRFRHIQAKGNKLHQLLSPVCLSFLILPVFFAADISTLPTDDYHWGEKLLPLFLYKEYGVIPYINYVMAHGFYDMMPALFADIFTEELTAQHILYGKFLSHAVVAMLSFWVLSYSFNLLTGIFSLLLLACFPNAPAFYLVAFNSLYLVLFRRWLFERPFLWLIYFALAGFILVLFNLGTGAALVLAGLPVAGYMLQQVIQDKTYRERCNIQMGMAVVLIVGVLLLTTPVWDVSLGIIRILLENAVINLEGFGIPWVFSVEHKHPLSLLFQNIWLLLVPGFLMGAAHYYKRDKLMAFMLLTFSLFALFIMSYALGRIGWGHLSRTGRISVIFLFLFLPVMIYNLSWDKDRRIYYRQMAGLAVFVLAFFMATKVTINRAGLELPSLSQPMYTTLMPDSATHTYVKGKDYSLENIGNIRIDNKQLDRLVGLRVLLDKYLDKDDTYLDLTNRNAHYFYMNRKLPIESGAFYNMAHRNQHVRSVEALQKIKPKLILLEADTMRLDRLTVSLRAYPIYRHLMLSDYTVMEEDGLVFLLRNDMHTGMQEQDIDLLSRVLGVSDLEHIPISWGYAYDSLKQHMSLVTALTHDKPTILHAMTKGEKGYIITAEDPYVVFSAPVEGRDAGIMLLDIQCDRSEKFKGQLYYTNTINHEFKKDFSYSFWLKNGINLIPVDLDPKWLLGGKLNRVRLDIHDHDACSVVAINRLMLYQRN